MPSWGLAAIGANVANSYSSTYVLFCPFFAEKRKKADHLVVLLALQHSSHVSLRHVETYLKGIHHTLGH